LSNQQFELERKKDIIAHGSRSVNGMKTIKKKPLTKKSTRLVISLFWFSIGCSPAGYLMGYIAELPRPKVYRPFQRSSIAVINRSCLKIKRVDFYTIIRYSCNIVISGE